MSFNDHIGQVALSEEAVERLIDALVDGGVVADDDSLASAATAVHSLATEPLPAATRQRHLAAIHGWLAPLPTRPRMALQRRFAAWATGLAAVATFGSGVTVAAADPAAPGDRLYGIDRAVERIMLRLQTDPEGDARLRLRHAQERVAELDDASEQRGRLVAEAVRDVRVAAHNAAAQAVATLAALLTEGVPDQARLPIARACLQIAERHAVDVEITACRLALATAQEGSDSAPPRKSRLTTKPTKPDAPPRRGPARAPAEDVEDTREQRREPEERQKHERREADRPDGKPSRPQRDSDRPANTDRGRDADDRADADDPPGSHDDAVDTKAGVDRGGDAGRGAGVTRRTRVSATATPRGS